ncbi:Crp/Fnr family transcriptional regulator [Rhizobium cremeum]|uniref:Crp/Fnr family transcriptional regulator n=1 Tax=Rhizobium cremeum TaxID=2813827 RepID=UPI000DDDC32D|nr:Crp/Fnr family transcriptional regulator [Rhizobium cremeum]MCJ7993517.1 Crp/Fnr family transcriptional regulator [Rhizobium cremeum]MCJ7998574.1 Crp/Fnr family transcriptional regulator [Rhizobium cremeum]
MAGWIDQVQFLSSLDGAAREMLDSLRPQHLHDRTTLFRPGDRAQAFVILLSGRIGVYLTGRNGRELLLYAVTPGETCVQTTLGVLGDAFYTGEAIAESELVAVMVPRAMFETLMAQSSAFRAFVFRAFAARLGDLMFVLEQVAFVKVEQRLAHALLERAGPDGVIVTTHQELAVVIGSAREVVSRRLEAFASKDLIRSERGQIRLIDRLGLQRLAECD